MNPLCPLGFLNRVKDYATTVSSRVGEVVSHVIVTLVSGDFKMLQNSLYICREYLANLLRSKKSSKRNNDMKEVTSSYQLESTNLYSCYLEINPRALLDPPTTDAAVPPWVGYNEEEEMKRQILDLSTDQRIFLRPPPSGVQFHFEFSKSYPVAMAILEEDEQLKKMRFELVPKK